MELHGLGNPLGGVPPHVGGAPPGGVPAPVPDAMREVVQEKLEAVQAQAFDVLGDAHLGETLASMGVRADPAHLRAARALIAETGHVDPQELAEVDRALAAEKAPDDADARAAAFLVARKLPATPAGIALARGRHDAPMEAGQRVAEALEQLAEAEVPREAGEPVPQPGKPSAPLVTEEAAAPSMAPSEPEVSPAVTRFVSALPPRARAELAQWVREHPAASAQELREVAQRLAVPAEVRAALAEASHESGPALMKLLARALAPEETPGLAAKPDAPSPETAKAPSPPSVPTPTAERLAAFTLPEGPAGEMAEALKRLVHALGAPERDLAQALTHPDPKGAPAVAAALDRVAPALEAIASDPARPAAQALRDEVRFTQLQATQGTPDQPPALVMPFVLAEGRGSIQVQEREARSADGQVQKATRVAIALDTPHLAQVRIDLLLAQGQVNCQLAVQDQDSASFLANRLDELQSALAALGIRVNALGVRTGTTSAPQAPSSGVDLYR